jgi:anti-sigma regulatory factor (Ser/Thr protein kinase)
VKPSPNSKHWQEKVLLASELAANAVTHSRSGHPGGVFTVRATLYHGDYAWVEVIDQGGVWVASGHDDEHGRDSPSWP